MSALSLPVHPRRRRTQAERSAATRARIIRAVVDCVGEVGFQRSTAFEIARRAGVTWGAVQHHFGGKDGILSAVLEDTFGRFASRFDDFPGTDRPLEERVSAFVERAWEHFASAHYRTTLEILLHYMPEHDPREGVSLQAQMLEAWDRLWTRLFADSPLPRRERLALERYTVSVLSGLALTRILHGRRAFAARDEVEILKRFLTGELRAAGTSAAQPQQEVGWHNRSNARRGSRSSKR